MRNTRTSLDGRLTAKIADDTVSGMAEKSKADIVSGGLLILPFPRFLPAGWSELRAAVHVLDDFALSPRRLFEDARGFVVAVGDCLGTHFSVSSPAQADPNRGAIEDFAEHDGFFRVMRVADNADIAFLAGTALSHARVLADLRTMGTTMTPEEVARLLDGYVLLYRCASSATDDGPTSYPARTSPLTDGDAYRPSGRWHLGHQHFFAQIQALVVALNILRTAVAQGDDPGVRSGLLLASRLALSAGAGLRYAGDFRSQDYRSVRVTMLPPRLNAGFSGMQTRDHHALVQVFRRLPLNDLRARSPEYGTFLTAIREMYTAHVHVCDHFGGRVGPSLRMETRSHEHSRGEASVVVEALAHGRLQILERP